MEPDSTRGASEPALEKLLLDLSSEVEEVRGDAVQTLALIGDGRCVEGLKRLTNDPSGSIRLQARKAISAIVKRTGPAAGTAQAPRTSHGGDEETEQFLEKLIERLQDPDPEVRRHAVVDTYDRRFPRLLVVLVKMFLSGEGPWIRSALVSAISRFRDPRTLPLLYQALDDEDSRVRANAVDALARFSEPRVLQQLARITRDPDNRVQANLAKALGQYSSDFLHRQVQKLLSSGQQALRESALYLLWAVRDEWCRDTLESLADDETNPPEFRAMARKYPEDLARLSGYAIPAARRSSDLTGDASLSSSLESRASSLSAAEARAVPAGAKPVSKLDVLLQRLTDPSPQVRLEALGEAAEYETDRVWERVEMLAMEKNDAIRNEARRMLRERYGQDAVQELSEPGLGNQSFDLAGGAPSPHRYTGAVSRAVRPPPATVRDPETGSGTSSLRRRIVTGAALMGLFVVMVVGLPLPGGELDQVRPAPRPDPRASAELATVVALEDLGNYIGAAVAFSGVIVQLSEPRDHLVIESAHGKVAVLLLRPLSGALAIGARVAVEGVLLGKTRGGQVLFRARKLEARK